MHLAAIPMSDAAFLAVADAAPVPMWISGREAGRAWFNRPWLELIGGRLADQIGAGWTRSVHPDDLDEVVRVSGGAMHRGEAFSVQYRLRAHDARYRWMLDNGAPYRDASGGLAGYIGSCIDISEQKRAEHAEAEARGYAEAIVETFHEPLLVLEPNLSVLSANPAFFSHFAVRPGSTLGRKIYDLGNGQWNIPALRRLLEEILPRNHVFDGYEVAHTFEGIGHRVMLLNARRLDHRQLVLLGIRDVTESRRVEGELRRRHADQQFRAALGEALQPVADPIQLQRRAARLVGEHLGATRAHYADLLDDGSVGVVHAAYHRPDVPSPAGKHSLSEFCPVVLEAIHRGEAFVVSDASSDPRLADAERERVQEAGRAGAFMVVPLLRGAVAEAILAVHLGRVHQWTPDEIALVRETAERTRAAVKRARAEEELRQSAARFRGLVDAAPSILWVTDQDHQCTYLSPGWHEHTGQPEALGLGMGWLAAVHADDRAATARVFAEATAHHRPFSLDCRLRTREGEYRWAIDTGRPRFDEDGTFLGFVGSVIDVHARKAAEDRLRIVTDAMPALISYVDASLVYRFANRECERWFGRARDQIVGRSLREVLGEPVMRILGPHLDAALRGRAVRVETPIPYPDGGLRWVDAQYIPDLDADGVVRGLFAMVVDITERKRADRTLRASEERFRQLAEAMPHLVWVARPNGAVAYLNSQAARYHAIAKSAGDGGTRFDWTPVVHKEDLQRTLAAWQVAQSSGGAFQCEHRLRVADGSYRWHLSRARLAGPKDARRWYGTATDIHDLKLAQEQAARLAAIVASSSDAIVGKTLDGIVTSWNAGAEHLFGYSAREMIGESILKIIPPERQHEESEILRRLQSGERLEQFESVRVAKDGRRIDVSLTISPVRDDRGQVVGAAKIVRDVSARNLAQRALHESEDRFRTLADNMSQFAWMTDESGWVFWFNKRWYEYTGTSLDQVRGWGWQGVLHADHVDRVAAKFKAALESGQPWEDTFPLRGQDGEYRWFLSRAMPIRDGQGRILRWFGTNTDITEQLELEQALARHAQELERRVEQRTRALRESYERLRLSERMAMMGTLSAGLGHDMGNLLLPIRVRLESLAMTPLDEQAREDVEAIRTSAEYLRRLASGLRLLALDPSRDAGAETVDLAAWWEEAEGVMRSVLSRNLRLRADIPPGLRINMHRAALTQVVFNLIQNAGDALRERGAGTISLSASAGDGCIRLDVADDGPGMSPEVRARCMEPLFTTKSRGSSTGLGLALVRGLVEDAGGRVELVSEQMRGTCFTLVLPAVEQPVACDADTPRPLACVELGDPRLRSLITKELESLGMDVAPAGAELADQPDLYVGNAPTHTAPRLSLLIGAPQSDDPRTVCLPERPSFAALLGVLRQIAGRLASNQKGSPTSSGPAEDVRS